MFQFNNQSIFSGRHRALWALLSTSAGMINAIAFVACGRFVSHVTGFATHFGWDLAQNQFRHAAGMLLVPLAFMGGAMLSAFWVDRRRIRGESPRHSFVFVLMALICGLCAALGTSGYFGVFGEPLVQARDFIFLCALCAVCGLQNAVVTSSSGAVVRTTHLTGYTTDLAVGIMRVYFMGRDQVDRPKETALNWVRVICIGSFVVGSVIGAWAALHHEYGALWLPTAISLGVALAGRSAQ